MKLTGPRPIAAISLVAAFGALVLACLTLVPRFTGNQRVLRVGVNHSPPYSTVGPDGIPRGFTVEVIREAARRAGLRIQLVVSPEGPDRALVAGKVDIWGLLIDIPERHKQIHFTDAWMRASYVLIVRRASGIENAEGAAGKRVLVSNLPIHTRIAKKTFTLSTLVPVKLGSELDGLCGGAADAAMVGSKEVLTQLLHRPPQCESTDLRIVSLQKAIYQMAVGANSDAFREAKRLRGAIAGMSADSTLDRLDRKWLNDSGDETAIVDQLQRAKRRNYFMYWASFFLAAVAGLLAWLMHRKRTAEAAVVERTAELAVALKRAESAAQFKGDFLATMSHEIRTPINGVLGMAELLLMSGLAARPRKLAQTLRDSAGALLSILNDVLDISKIEAGKLDLETADFDLRDLMEGVADLMALSAQEKGLELTCIIEPKVCTQLRGDPTRLRQVLLNLVGNAVKFTLRGEVSLRVSVESATNKLRFEIADSGIGIPKEKQHLLFQRFSQAEASTTRQFGGSGLGLSIVSSLVEKMGGETGFESTPGKGSVFWFTADLARQKDMCSSPALSLSGRRVLLVDDNTTSRAVTREFLRNWQCDVEEAVTSKEALSRLQDQKLSQVDAFIVDPDGADHAEESIVFAIRADPRLTTLPIILLTPLSRIETAQGWESKANIFSVTKPVKEAELGRCLASVLELGPVEVAEMNEGRFETRERSTCFRLLVVDDNPVNQQVAMGMLDCLGLPCVVAANAYDAINELQTYDYDLVLTDCQMPEMDGYELAQKIRDPGTKVKNRAIPIVALTANSLPGEREKCLDAGMNDYLAKPFQIRQLDEVLMRWLVTPDAVPAAVLKEPTDSGQFNADDLVRRLMGNRALAKRVAAMFVETMPQQLTALTKALENADPAAARLVAHSIKGSAANLGGTCIRDIAAQMETFGESGAIEPASDLLPQLRDNFQSIRPLLEQFLTEDVGSTKNQSSSFPVLSPAQ